MTAAKPPSNTSDSREIDAFLQHASRLPARTEAADRPRLLFALDATASRQPTWDRARQLQSDMFRAAAGLRGLAMQLCFYRGFGEFRASRWLSDSSQLLKAMNSVHCVGGHTQLRRVLAHALEQGRSGNLRAVVFVGDALEENPDPLCQRAGELKLLGVPLFIFQEGNDPTVAEVFRQLARLSGGAYARFDSHSADYLRDLLTAAASYASGGLDALSGLDSAGARALLQQLHARER